MTGYSTTLPEVKDVRLFATTRVISFFKTNFLLDLFLHLGTTSQCQSLTLTSHPGTKHLLRQCLSSFSERKQNFYKGLHTCHFPSSKGETKLLQETKLSPQLTIFGICTPAHLYSCTLSVSITPAKHRRSSVMTSTALRQHCGFKIRSRAN